ncbi:MAG TPA: lipid-binding SYLF domain-containing protein [Vicinamibacterales bacterium]|nr:lipid-binding SYLF domain-containing protein [Vicinamibacterales bacterium]
MYKLAVAVVCTLTIAASARADITAGEKGRLQSAARITQDVREIVPADFWNRARCVVVIPELKKAALVIGGEYGKGVMSCRAASFRGAGAAGEGWTAPVFLQLAKGSWGFQAGAEQVDVVMLVMNEDGVQKLLQSTVTLGADASVAAGPIGRQGQVATDAQMKAELISYSRAQGLFAGINLSGGVLRPDEDANRNAYGGSATLRSILATRDISAPTEAQAFLSALAKGQSAPAERDASAQSRSSSSPPRPAPTVPTTDDDVRARVVSLQQAIDRLLAEPGAAGTSGPPEPRPGATVTVDRARLAQIRQQLDALLAALDKK